MRVRLSTTEVLNYARLGEFSKNGTLTYKEQMVNPYTYTQFIVTEEPFEDADPNATLIQAEHDFRHLSDANPIFFRASLHLVTLANQLVITLQTKVASK